SDPVPVARLDTWAHGNAVFGGPASDQVSVFGSATWTRSSHFERSGLTPLDANLASGFLNVVATPTSRDQLRLTGWVQRTRDPLEHHAALGQPDAAERDRALHAQGAWERQLASGRTGVRAFGGVTIRNREADLTSSPPFIIIDRLTDGPVPDLLSPGNGTDRVLQAGGPRARTPREGGPPPPPPARRRGPRPHHPPAAG